jgi:hypothetical protein
VSVRERFDDWLNPIAVKELRQAVRGKFVAVAVILSLLGELIAVAVITISRTINGSTVPIGPIAFSALFGIIFTAALFLVPIYTGFRMAAERADTNIDLLFVTTIRPLTIVLGKITSAAMLIILLFSASLPFLVFSYVLRGIDFVSILGMIAFSIVIVISQSTLALFVGALPTSKPFKLFLAVGFFIGTFFIYVPFLEMMSHVMRGFGSYAGVSRSLPVLITFIVFVVVVNAILIVLTTTIITPAAANRSLPIRLMITAAAILSFLGALWLYSQTLDFDAFEVWAAVTTFIITLVLLSATSERQTWGPRITRTIPARPGRRALAFVFYSGAANGIVWALLMYGTTVAAFATAGELFERNAKWPLLLDAFLAMIGYAMTAVFLRRRFLQRVPASRTWGIALALFFLLTVLPPLGMIVTRDAETQSWGTWVHITTLLNPFPMPQRPLHLAHIRTGILAAWAFLALAVNAGWFLDQMRRFSAPRPDEDVTALAPENAA